MCLKHTFLPKISVNNIFNNIFLFFQQVFLVVTIVQFHLAILLCPMIQAVDIYIEDIVCVKSVICDIRYTAWWWRQGDISRYVFRTATMCTGSSLFEGLSFISITRGSINMLLIEHNFKGEMIWTNLTSLISHFSSTPSLLTDSAEFVSSPNSLSVSSCSNSSQIWKGTKVSIICTILITY